jgi:hypothetical protein
MKKELIKMKNGNEKRKKGDRKREMRSERKLQSQEISTLRPQILANRVR